MARCLAITEEPVKGATVADMLGPWHRCPQVLQDPPTKSS